MTSQREPLKIDIVSDVVCPWCIVGYRQLQIALDETGVEAEIRWHPFELNPPLGNEGQNLGEHLREKYGTTPADSKAMRQKLTDIGEGLDFEFNFGEDMRIYNTFDAHRLMHWADREGRKHDLKQAFFKAYFTDGLALNDHTALVSVASSIGLDAEEALKVLETGQFAKEVRKAEQHWISRGVSGVPAIIFDGKHQVSGAQGVENFGSIIRQLTSKQS